MANLKLTKADEIGGRARIEINESLLLEAFKNSLPPEVRPLITDSRALMVFSRGGGLRLMLKPMNEVQTIRLVRRRKTIVSHSRRCGISDVILLRHDGFLVLGQFNGKSLPAPPVGDIAHLPVNRN